ncbi:DUF262 domain-containing protein [Cryptosporangium sp. NPDC048952]|uniref:GmrSD restriction endonuclease domain-containing protein n=1 Tax=Cryptosporangium sp. NPDC048952 TaxID=3363961 RepID=UPI00371B9C60
MRRPFRLLDFQREYVWEKDQVQRLVADLERKFTSQHDSRDTTLDVASYDPYFLGCMIIWEDAGCTYLADGQQRLTTLFILLIYLSHLTSQRDDCVDQWRTLDGLIRTAKLGNHSYAIDLEEYQDLFDALVAGRGYPDDGSPDIHRVQLAYSHIVESFPIDLGGENLALFVEWLLYRVSVVTLSAGDRDRAREMFQTMNGTGVNLTSLDYLKTYLLGDAPGTQQGLDRQWHNMVASIERVKKGAALSFLQSAFRAQFPELQPYRVDGIALDTSTHDWVKLEESRLWPEGRKGQRAKFFAKTLLPLSEIYVTLLKAEGRLTKGLEAVRYNSFNGINCQFDLVLAAVQPLDSRATKERKARLVAEFIDFLFVMRAIDDPADHESVPKVIENLLGRARLTESEDGLRKLLKDESSRHVADAHRLDTLQYRASNRSLVLYLLTRLTAWVEAGMEKEPDIEGYLGNSEVVRHYEIEHLFTRKPGVYDPGSGSLALRARLGALVLLDGLDNSSLGGLPFDKKTAAYLSQNTLAASLHEAMYDKGHARFLRFVANQKMKNLFQPFRSGDAVGEVVERRQALYRAIFERVWSTENFAVLSSATDASAKRNRRNYGVGIADLQRARLIATGERLTARRRGKTFEATVRADGQLDTGSGEFFASPTAAQRDVLPAGVKGTNGWVFWSVARTGETLGAIRALYESRRQ